MATQLNLDLPVRTALARDDFMIAPSNAVAAAMIDRWRDWPGGKLVLTGPPGAGKTHLVHVWAAETGARILAASDLAADSTAPDDTTPIAVEDVDTIAADLLRQTALFHLHNTLQATGVPLLMTGTQAPNLWRLSLPDLQSRVDGTGHAAVDAPDDTLLAAVLAKLFMDRQLAPRADVIPYLVTRMERSFDAARRIVADLDAASLRRKRAITRALAAEWLDKDARDGG